MFSTKFIWSKTWPCIYKSTLGASVWPCLLYIDSILFKKLKGTGGEGGKICLKDCTVAIKRQKQIKSVRQDKLTRMAMILAPLPLLLLSNLFIIGNVGNLSKLIIYCYFFRFNKSKEIKLSTNKYCSLDYN